MPRNSSCYVRSQVLHSLITLEVQPDSVAMCLSEAFPVWTAQGKCALIKPHITHTRRHHTFPVCRHLIVQSSTGLTFNMCAMIAHFVRRTPENGRKNLRKRWCFEHGSRRCTFTWTSQVTAGRSPVGITVKLLFNWRDKVLHLFFQKNTHKLLFNSTSLVWMN